MKNPEIVIKGATYPLSTTLRVAYKIQGMNDHKPYLELFQDLPNLPVEKQIEFIYAAFECANPGKFTAGEFSDYLMDTMNVSSMLDTLRAITNGIMGVSDEEDNNKESKPVDGDAKNG